MNPPRRSRHLPGIALIVAGLMLAVVAQARDAPAERVREAITAARLHTTIDSLLAGNIERMMAAPRVSDARHAARCVRIDRPRAAWRRAVLVAVSVG